MSTDYDDSNIQVLEGLAAVRFRPGMYIGNTSLAGLHHLVYEVVDSSIEEALAGYCKNIDILINANGSITITDDGRGIESQRDRQTDEFSIEPIFTILHIGKYRDYDYRIGGALHGVGLAVVSALSAHVEVKVYRKQKIYTQRFEQGISVSALETIDSESDRTGTTITFLPDPEIFQETVEFDFQTLSHRFRELAGINGAMRISLTDGRLQALVQNQPKRESYYYEGGLRDYLSDLNRDKQPLHQDIIYIGAEEDRIRVEVALQWCVDSCVDRILGFANTVQTIEGGQHCDGVKMAVTHTLNKIARQRNQLQPDDDNFAREYIPNGLTAIVSVLLPNPEWAGPIKAKLVNSEVQGLVDSIVGAALTKYFAAHPDVADAIIARAGVLTAEKSNGK